MYVHYEIMFLLIMYITCRVKFYYTMTAGSTGQRGKLGGISPLLYGCDRVAKSLSV